MNGVNRSEARPEIRQRTKASVLLLFFAFLCASVAAVARAGTLSASTVHELERALERLQPGDLLRIAPGIYRGTFRITASGTRQNPIIIEAAGAVIEGRTPIPREFFRRDPDGLWTAVVPRVFQAEPYGPSPDEFSSQRMVVTKGDRRLRPVIRRQQIEPGTFLLERDTVYMVDDPEEVEVSVLDRGLAIEGSFIEVRGLAVQGFANGYEENDPEKATWAFRVGGTDNRLVACRSTGNNTDGFLLKGARLRLIDCTADDNGRCGFTGNPSDSTLEGCSASGNGWRFGPEWHTGGIKFIGGEPRNILVRRFRATKNHGPGIWLDFCGPGCVVEDSTADLNQGRGIFIECTMGAIVRNNTVTRTIRYEGELARETGVGISVYSSPGTRIEGNTLAWNEGWGVLVLGGDRGDGRIPRDHAIFRNLFVHNVVAPLKIWCWYPAENVLRSLRSDENFFDPDDHRVIDLAGEQVLGLLEWARRSGQDRSSRAGNSGLGSHPRGPDEARLPANSAAAGFGAK
jgi:hypothetical protein